MLVADLIQENLGLDVRCEKCERIVIIEGRKLLARFEAGLNIRTLQRNFRRGQIMRHDKPCGGRATVRITIPDKVHERGIAYDKMHH